MADDGKPAHYSEKMKAEIEALKAENDALRKAAGTSMSVVGAPDRSLHAVIFAAMFIAANEARNMGTESLFPLMKDRWHAARQLREWVESGEDMKDYEARQAALKEEQERPARQAILDAEGKRRNAEAARARQRGGIPADATMAPAS